MKPGPESLSHKDQSTKDGIGLCILSIRAAFRVLRVQRKIFPVVVVVAGVAAGKRSSSTVAVAVVAWESATVAVAVEVGSAKLVSAATETTIVGRALKEDQGLEFAEMNLWGIQIEYAAT